MATPHPTPTKLLELTKGKLYSDQRDRAELEPKPKRELTPWCPSTFTKEQRTLWRFYKRILNNYGLFNLAAGPVLEKLCVAEDQYRQCAETVATTGIIIKGALGQPVQNPYWQVMSAQEKKILSYLQELGLSTTGLAKMGALMLKAKKEKNELETLLD